MPPSADSAICISPQDISATYERIAPRLRRTPVIEVRGADFGIACEKLWLKLESLQHAGSFKARGAFSNLLTRTVPAVGVVAASGGNHGAAVAYAARELGISAKIFVPTVVSAAKVALLKSFGADLVIGGALYADALAAGEIWQRETGALPVHAYDQRETLMGQGTAALEFESQVADLDTVLVAVGGGGLIGGVAAWFGGNGGRVKVVSVEPYTAPTLYEAHKAGQPVDAPAGGIAADSLAPRQVGQLMFPIAERYVSEYVLVEDDAIREAQKTLWKSLRVVAEPGGAAAFSALLSGAYRPKPGERVGLLVCGGNTTAVDFDK